MRTYDAGGNLSTVTRQSATGFGWSTVGTTTYAYDADNRTTGITDSGAGGGALASYAYAYDVASRLTH
ncbi:hypothetical protein [Fimbriiglobus ruber]|uniref:Flagellar hook protein FlgE n=1 Tax=Fimbriiglobus ruber TaxID=1908690 RepID=A0A225DG02_9BACT|nr:hypothetical protein [Fimbriiglobus ruber]OWK35325.1 Flagellar hook protein FlgE [Fimbriiglobus ruber]